MSEQKAHGPTMHFASSFEGFVDTYVNYKGLTLVETCGMLKAVWLDVFLDIYRKSSHFSQTHTYTHTHTHTHTYTHYIVVS